MYIHIHTNEKSDLALMDTLAFLQEANSDARSSSIIICLLILLGDEDCCCCIVSTKNLFWRSA